ncbi:MAG: DUF2130 domain-containing protein [Microgenomates group bacterium]|nr:DUF2130 domain-containing protein [Microgenomates group bacterium]
MNDQIICPHCKKPIPLSEALSHQIQEKYQRFYRQRLAEEKLKLEKDLKEELTKKIKNEMAIQFKDKTNQVEELKQQNQSLQKQLLELNRLIRQLRSENERKKLELEKKLMEEEEKIRLEEKRRINEEYRLKILEKDKQMEDMRKQIEELKRKSELTSQQLQGEVLELELEKQLSEEFPNDEIRPVAKGVSGADLLQIVKNESGRKCGTIIWELKRTKNWSDGWINKLKQDQRQEKAELAVIISQSLPPEIKNFGQINNVWVGNFESALGLAIALRQNLINLSSIKLSMVGKQEKKEILWNYLTGIEFKQRVEAIYEAYNQLQEDLETERRWFTKKWAKQEKNIRLVVDNILGMHGDLQGIVGKTLLEIKNLNLLSSGKKEE